MDTDTPPLSESPTILARDPNAPVLNIQQNRTPSNLTSEGTDKMDKLARDIDNYEDMLRQYEQNIRSHFENQHFQELEIQKYKEKNKELQKENQDFISKLEIIEMETGKQAEHQEYMQKLIEALEKKNEIILQRIDQDQLELESLRIQLSESKDSYLDA